MWHMGDNVMCIKAPLSEVGYIQDKVTGRNTVIGNALSNFSCVHT